MSAVDGAPPPPPRRDVAAVPAGHYTVLDAIRHEWVKLRSVRSTWWCLLIFAAIMIGFSILFCAVTANRWAELGPEQLTFDPVTAGLAGVTMGSLALGVLGVLVVGSEYGTGAIRSTLAAIPRRPLVVLAKAILMAVVIFVVAEIFAFAGFVIGQAILSGSLPASDTASLGGPGVLEALLATGCYLTLLVLFCVGLAFIIRNTAGAISAFVGILFPLYLIVVLLPSSISNTAREYLPLQIQQQVVSSRALPDQHMLSTWTGIGVMVIYAVVALGLGGLLLVRRDA